MPMNIAIDGPVGAGKSSIADQVAQRLHILHLDTGAMYRTVALYMLRNGIDPQDEQAVSACCGKADVRVAYRDGAQRTMLGEEDVTDLIRTGEVSAAASGISKWPAVRRRMVAAQREIAATAEAVQRAGLRIVSLYIGGGTPTTLSACQLDALCTQLEAAFDLSALREFTVEAGRPDTITADKLHVLRAHRVDRISVNPQTLDDRVLETIGRRHTAQDIFDALRLVRGTGGFAVNMDLIAGLPGDTPDGFRATLEQVLALAPENVTVHTLSRKRGADLMTQDAPIPDGEQVGEMLDFAGSALDAAGYAPYYLYRQKFMSGGFENVGWTRPGQENLYNICIMEELCSILAMGGGASTKLVRPNGGRLERHIDPKYPTEYIANIDRICAAKAELEAFFQ